MFNGVEIMEPKTWIVMMIFFPTSWLKDTTETISRYLISKHMIILYKAFYINLPLSRISGYLLTCMVQKLFYMQSVLTRVNSITGVAYKDDSTIFAWELMNEPRCQSDLSGKILEVLSISVSILSTIISWFASQDN